MPAGCSKGSSAGSASSGAGAIIRDRNRVFGATTGAGIWVVGAIGMACGFGFYFPAVAVTLLALFVLTVLGFLERSWGTTGRSQSSK
jgi:putative Mg2+ transporter-C (MgtC) family protein